MHYKLVKVTNNILSTIRVIFNKIVIDYDIVDSIIGNYSMVFSSKF